MHIVVIANPVSSRGGGLKKRELLIRSLDTATAGLEGQVTYQIIETKTPGQAVQTGSLVQGSAGDLAHRAAAEGTDIVAAAGGDGTVGEVANGLVGTNAILGVLPMGTGNDFARTLGIGTDLQLAANALVRGYSCEVDLGKISNGGYFINVAGCGFDAEVATRVNQGFRWVHGTMAYVVAVLQTLIRFRPTRISLVMDGASREEIVMLCAIANAKTYGGGMRVAPDADISDGLFDIVLVGNVSRFEFLRAFPSVFKGTHISHPKVQVFRASKVSISSLATMAALADGEEIGNTPVEFQIIPRAIKVICPPQSGGALCRLCVWFQ